MLTPLYDSIGRLSKLSGYTKPTVHDGLRMDSNENLAIGDDFQSMVLDSARRRVDARQYPVDGVERVVAALSSYMDVPSTMVSVGSGSDQILDMLLGGLINRGDKVVVTDPTFSFFFDRCTLYGMDVTHIPYGHDMTVSTDAIIRESANASLVYLDSPNNPTGYQIPMDDIVQIAESFKGLVILDEAYAEFADYSAYTMPRKYPNMVVVRTLSKSFGMAGLRVGYMVADDCITDVFGRILQYPYPISSVSAEAAVLALGWADTVSESWELVRNERARIIEELRGHDRFTVFDSSANFVLFDAGRSCLRIHEALAEQGIYVRLLGRIGDADGCIRVSVGSRPMNSRFLTAMRDLLK